MDSNPSPSISRRSLLISGAAVLVGAACSSDATDEPDSAAAEPTATSEPEATVGATTEDAAAEPEVDEQVDAETVETSAALEPLTPAMFAAVGTCGLLANSGPGPFPTTEQLNRQDVTEGYPGHPVRLGLRVLDAECEPVPGADLEIWHTDASGDYSEYEDNGSGKDEGPGSTFCRGYQTTDSDGICEFDTIYPGWYEGRPPHIHVRVRRDGELVWTGQFFYEDDYSEAIYQTGAYEEFGTGFTRNNDDGTGRTAEADGAIATAEPAETNKGPGTLSLINIGV